MMGGAGHSSRSRRGLMDSSEAHNEEEDKTRWEPEVEKVGDAL